MRMSNANQRSRMRFRHCYSADPLTFITRSDGTIEPSVPLRVGEIGVRETSTAESWDSQPQLGRRRLLVAIVRFRQFVELPLQFKYLVTQRLHELAILRHPNVQLLRSYILIEGVFGYFRP